MNECHYIPHAREKARAPQPSVTQVVDEAHQLLTEFDALLAKFQQQVEDLV